MPRILIADDEWLTRTEVAEMLTALEYEVTGQAESGQEAVDMAREQKPDLIIMDVVLPGEMDGIAAAEKIKAELDIPIMFVSGYGEPRYIERAKNIEAYGYVMKPFDEKEVWAFVEIALHKREMEVKLKQAHDELSRINLQLRKASREWEEIFQAIGQATLILDMEHTILNGNRSAFDTVGNPGNDLVGQKCYRIFHDAATPPEGCPFEKMKISGQLETAEMELEMPGRIFLVSCTPMVDQQGRLERCIHIATDITEKKRLEIQNRQAQKMKAISILAGGIAYQKLRQIRIHGQKVKHQHPLVGINGRLDTLQAVILLEKFTLFPEEVTLRQEVAHRYDALLSASNVQCPTVPPGFTSVYAQYTILTENRDALTKTLQQKDIPSVAYYAVPLHLQGAFADLGHKPGDFPVAERVAAQCLSLPMSPYLTQEDQEAVAVAMG